MLRTRFRSRNAAQFLGCALLLTLTSATALAAPSIDLSLNVLYANPGNPQGGGTYELVAKTNADGFGLYGVSALLTNVSNTSVNVAPRGAVNGMPNSAGFGFVANSDGPGESRNITLGQVKALSGEQTAFYGVGTLVNGAPNYPGKPVGSTSIGPLFTTLTNVQGVAWATGDTFNDPAWATGVKLATGTFAPGVTPGFYSNADDFSIGNVFTSLGTSSQYGMVTAQNVVATTIVRTNFVATPANGDYNHNGVVDAADYIVWRNTLGLSSPLDADGNTNGMIDPGDYDVWKSKFGTVISGAGSAIGAVAVPEPSAAFLLAIGGVFVFQRRSRQNELQKIRARRNCWHACSGRPGLTTATNRLDFWSN